MGKTTGLNRRKGSTRLQFRRRWPTDIAHLLPGEGMARSTGSGDYADARRRFREIEEEYDRLVEDARLRAATPSHGIYSRSLPSTPKRERERFMRVLTDADAYRIAHDYTVRCRLDFDREPLPTERDEVWQRLIEIGSRGNALDDPNSLQGQSLASGVADYLREEAKLHSEPGSASERLLVELVRRSMVQLVAMETAQLSGERISHIADAFLNRFPATETQRAVAPAGITLAALIEQFDREFIHGEDITAKTMNKNRAALTMIRRYFGEETAVAMIDREALVGFRDTLAMLPPNVTKKFGSTADLKQIATENSESRGSILNRETQTTYLRLANSLFEFAKERRHVAYNDAANLRPKGRATPAQARRRPFTPAQLRTIFTAPIYTGCVDDERGYAKCGPNHPRRSRFWVPLIALFTGLRMEEILQLTPGHIQMGRDDLPFAFISPEMKVKTENGFREVPIHRELLRIGFMVHVAERRRAGEDALLFDDVPAASDGYRSTNFSKRFATFLKSLGIKDDPRRTCFHSYRHNFRDGLRQPAANPDFIREAGGWASRDTSDIYGDGTPAHLMRALIDGIDYELSLQHLYRTE